MEIDKIYLGDSRNMDKIDDESVHLVFGSPPYGIGKKYEAYLNGFDEYLQLLYDVYAEVSRTVIPGGKIGINICDIATGSRYNEGFPEEVMVIPKLVDHLKSLGCYLYARCVWVKTSFPWTNSPYTHFGSKTQHSEYRVLPSWEYVFIFRKGEEQRKDKSYKDGLYISKNEWKEWVTGVWYINSVSRNTLHEAQFPDELAKRVIKMYSFPGDIVLDCWMGSGTVAKVAHKLGRKYLGYELDPDYHKLCLASLSQKDLFLDYDPDLIENQEETEIEAPDILNELFNERNE